LPDARFTSLRPAAGHNGSAYGLLNDPLKFKNGFRPARSEGNAHKDFKLGQMVGDCALAPPCYAFKVTDRELELVAALSNEENH
jgi:hypothetical protein